MSNDTQTWPDLAIGLYDKLTGRGAQISYEMDDLNVRVPSRVGEDVTYARLGGLTGSGLLARGLAMPGLRVRWLRALGALLLSR